MTIPPSRRDRVVVTAPRIERGWLASETRTETPRAAATARDIPSLRELSRNFWLFNHGLLFCLLGVDPAADPFREAARDLKCSLVFIDSPVPLFLGVAGIDADEVWNRRLYAVERGRSYDFQKRSSEAVFASRTQRWYARPEAQVVWVPDPFAAKIVTAASPRVAVTAYGLDSDRGRYVFTEDRADPLRRYRATKLPATMDAKLLGERFAARDKDPFRERS